MSQKNDILLPKCPSKPGKLRDCNLPKMSMVINHVCYKKLPEHLGLHCYAESTHPGELGLEPSHKKILDPPMLHA